MHREVFIVAVHSPVKLVVVIMCLKSEVKPDEEQTKGKKEDEGP